MLDSVPVGAHFGPGTPYPDLNTSQNKFCDEKHRIDNIPLDACTKTNIEGYAMTMYSSDKSTDVSLKNI